MAHRLSAKSANKVLLCEAGQDTPPGNEPPEIRDSYSGMAYFDPRFHWTELRVTTQVVSHNNPEEDRPPLRKYEQARVLGGGSSINGQLANRGAPTDYDEWEARGATGWSWKDVLPYFKKVERDLDFDGPFHGKDGRIPVRRMKEMGIPIVMGLEGVGQRLMDHPSIALSSFIHSDARMNEHTRRHIQVALRYSSGLPGVPKGDMFVAVMSKSAWHAVGAQI